MIGSVVHVVAMGSPTEVARVHTAGLPIGAGVQRLVDGRWRGAMVCFANKPMYQYGFAFMADIGVPISYASVRPDQAIVRLGSQHNLLDKCHRLAVRRSFCIMGVTVLLPALVMGVAVAASNVRLVAAIYGAYTMGISHLDTSYVLSSVRTVERVASTSAVRTLYSI